MCEHRNIAIRFNNASGFYIACLDCGQRWGQAGSAYDAKKEGSVFILVENAFTDQSLWQKLAMDVVP